MPFHFYRGGEGDSLSENLVCQKDSKLAQEMVVNHVWHAVATLDGGGLELIGVMAHDLCRHFFALWILRCEFKPK